MQATDLLASGIHDAKNRLFEAHALLAQADDAQPGLTDARLAIEAAALRLSKTLVAYRMMQQGQPLAVTPVVVGEWLEELADGARASCRRAGIALEAECGFDGAWPFDRQLVADALTNALQNACRYARGRVLLRAAEGADGLCLSVHDDGPGCGKGAPSAAGSGVGLFIAGQLAQQHRRHGRQGRLALADGGAYGGACFELVLP